MSLDESEAISIVECKDFLNNLDLNNKFVFYYIKLASYIFNNQKIGNLRSRIDVRLSVSEMEQDFCKLYK